MADVFVLFEGTVCLETNKIVLLPLMRLDGRHDLLPPCAKRNNLFAGYISQVDLSGPERRVCREDLAPVDVLMTAAAMAMEGFG